jgi:hypothetical protein
VIHVVRDGVFVCDLQRRVYAHSRHWKTHRAQVLLSGHFILFFSMFVLLIVFSIFPVIYLKMQPPSAIPRPKGEVDPSESSLSSETKPSDAADAPPPPKQDDNSSAEPGLLALIVCMLAAAAVLLQHATLK